MKLMTLGLLLCLHSWGVQAADIVVTKAWVREAPPNANVMAAYMQIKNTSEYELVLNAVQSQDFKQVEVHKTVIIKSVSSMKPVEELILSAGETVEFKPNGLHLMLINPKKPLKAGDTVNLSLYFSLEQEVILQVPVKKAGSSRVHQHHH